MRAFIVRPFGNKNGIDFDRVEAELIAPALERTAISGSTTGEIVYAGNIRSDMFESLLMADLVIADISVHNANVFYELGVRHALRARRTVLIRAKGKRGDSPFDLATDRYVVYDAENPSASSDDLAAVMKAVLASDRPDSPVFWSLPELVEQDRARLTPVPKEFQEDVQRAAASRRPGMLGLLGWEAQGFGWENEGRRIVGRQLTRLKAFPQALTTWEEVRNFEPLDREANLMLATIHQRLGDLASSDQCLERVLANPACTPGDRSEAFALLARNDKSRWQTGWAKVDGAERPRQALRSPFLLKSYKSYRRAFAQNLNHFYSGLNALSLVVLTLELAKLEPTVWAEIFETDQEGVLEFRKLEKARGDLTGAVGVALEGARAQLPERGEDIWLDISEADFKFLTLQRTPPVVSAYMRALARASAFHADSARGQLQLFEALSIMGERVRACLDAFPAPTAPRVTPVAGVQRAVVFTGHRVDAPGRANPRFPGAAEPLAREAILRTMTEIASGDPKRVIGVAGAASGGDILFHEVCAGLGMPTLVRLALPPDDFAARSVADAGESWVKRFHAIVERGETDILSQSETLPGWLQRKNGYDIWQRNNIWLLQEALAQAAPETILIALWDGKPGDGPGGTNHMVTLAQERGVRTIILDTNKLFG
jgi:hypothetical protein